MSHDGKPQLHWGLKPDNWYVDLICSSALNPNLIILKQLYWSNFMLRHLLSLCSEAFSVCPLDPFRRNAKGKYTLNYNTAPTIVWVSGSIYRVFDWENNRSELLMGKWLTWNDLICNSLQSSTKIKLWQERKPHSYPLFKYDGCLHSVYSYRLTVL